MEIDMNKRVQLPEIEQKELIISKGMNGVLYVFYEKQWKQFVHDVLDYIPLTSRDGRTFLRVFKGSAIECEVEEDGKISIPLACWEFMANTGKNKAVEIHRVKEYLDIQKENVNQMEKGILKYVEFIIMVPQD